jgi:hypothetical protein
MKLKTHLAALALCSAVPMAAALDCTSTTDWGRLDPLGLHHQLGKTFNSLGTYRDCFTFSLASPADSLSGELIKGGGGKSVELFQGDAIVPDGDKSPHKFSFGSLAGGGGYTLLVVSKDKGNSDNPRVGYIGKITTVATSVPEPAAYALAVIGLIVVGAAALRRKPR